MCSLITFGRQYEEVDSCYKNWASFSRIAQGDQLGALRPARGMG